MNKRKKLNLTHNLWEHVSVSAQVGDTYRMKVPGGWLYRHETYGAVPESEVPAGIGMVFVPEPLQYSIQQ